MVLAAVILIPPIVMFAGGHLAWIGIGVAWLVIWTAIYVVSLRLSPERACHACHGSGARRGLVFKHALGRCWCCRGAKVHTRWGVRVLRVMPSPSRVIDRDD